MALVQATIQSEIKAAFMAVLDDNSDNREGAVDRVAQKLASAIVNAIKSQQITYSSGLTAPNGPVTGKFGCTIS